MWASWKWAFIKYFQTAGTVFEQSGHVTGTFKHGKDGDDSAVTLYEYFTFLEIVFDLFLDFHWLFSLLSRRTERKVVGGGTSHRVQLIRSSQDYMSANVFKYLLSLGKVKSHYCRTAWTA